MSNDNDSQDKITEEELEEAKVRRKSVILKIRAFEALARSNEPDLQKPQNWWLGQKDNDQEYIRESILFSVSQNKDKRESNPKLLVTNNQKIVSKNRQNGDVIQNCTKIEQDVINVDENRHNSAIQDKIEDAINETNYSSQRLSISPTFLNSLNETVSKNEEKLLESRPSSSVPDTQSKTDHYSSENQNNFSIYESDQDLSHTSIDKPATKPPVPIKPERFSKQSYPNSLYEYPDGSKYRLNSIYSRNSTSNQAIPYQIKRLSVPESHFYEEINYDFRSANIRRKSTSSMSNVSMSLPEKNSTKLFNVIQEVITLEENYISRLERGIEIYIHQGVKLIEDIFQSEYKSLFGNLLKIYDFHKDQLFRSLVACNQDVFNIANVFHTYITNDSFYPYVLFQVDRVRIEKMITKHKQHFDELSKANGDKLGIKNFLMEPVQRLPRYTLLFAEIIKLLSVNDETVKNFLSVCCMTEKQLRRLIICVDQAISLTDLDIYSDFDWREKGKFKKMSTLKYIDVKNHKQFESHVYLFENSLLCTQSDNLMENRLHYHTHIELEDIYFIEFLDDTTIQLTLRWKEICFSGDTATIQEWVTALKSINGSYEEKDFLVINDNKWDENQYLQVLKRVEKNYINFMNSNKPHYLKNSSTKLIKFESTLDKVLAIHSDKIIPVLESKETTFLHASETIATYIENGIFETYKNYVVLIPETLELLSKVMNVSPALKDFLKAPLCHIQNIRKLINKIVKTSIKSGSDSVDMKLMLSIGNLQKEFCMFHKLVIETFKVHNEIKELPKNVRSFGVVKFSDLVSSKIDANNKKQLKIFLMEKGLILVKLTTNLMDPDDEIFRSIKWHLPYPVTYDEVTNPPELLKLYATGPKHKSYKIVFQTQNKKQKFVEHLQNLIKFVSV